MELVSFSLASKASIILYDGSPFVPNYEHLFRISEKEKITFFGTGAKYIDTLKNKKINIKKILIFQFRSNCLYRFTFGE